MKKTYDEILEILQKYFSDENEEDYSDGVSRFAHDDFDSEEIGLGPINEVHSEGGEDEGSHWVSVKHFVDHDIYIAVTGYYQSHHGTDFDNGWGCCSEVRPKNKTVVVYE